MKLVWCGLKEAKLRAKRETFPEPYDEFASFGLDIERSNVSTIRAAIAKHGNEYEYHYVIPSGGPVRKDTHIGTLEETQRLVETLMRMGV